MRRTATLATLAAAAALLLTEAATAGQDPAGESTFIAFRVDTTHVIATLKVLDHIGEALPGLSPEPAARLGFRYADAPPEWRAQVAADARAGERWVVHLAPGQEVSADAERIVGGQLACQDAIGVLLRVAPESVDTLARLPAKYFLAARARSDQPNPHPPNATSSLGAAKAPSGDPFRRALETNLHEVLAKELPGVRAEAESDLTRAESSGVDHRQAWARQVRAIDAAMQRGRGRLRYDIQSFHLSPDHDPVHFVRAEWMVDGRQGFAASVWLRGEQRLRLVETSTRPASWLRMPEFEGAIGREQMGMILNVFDRDRNGWGEVLLVQAGYEGEWLSLLEYSENGFHPTGIGYSYGC